jgi:spore coat protein A, manganese oxidase
LSEAGDERLLNRRRFVTGTAAGAAALALPAWLRPAGRSVDVASARGVEPFARRLPIPRELRSANLTIPIQQAEIPILPGRTTTMWTYGGTFPGPTVRRPSGQRTNVTFQHRLPARAGELTVHLHGAHTRSEDDGQPGGLTESQPRSLYCDISPRLSAGASGNDLLIYPGGSRTYRHDFTEDGKDERAAMHWYHDHRLDRTGENVWRGLAGMWITEDEVDLSLPLPRGKRDLSLMVADRSFNAQNQLTSPFGKQPPNDGVTGKHVLVNGAILPFHPVSAQRYRLRILNASNFRPYNLAFDSPGALPVAQIATESGLMPQAIERNQIFIGPGERVELIVDFAAARGGKVVLESVPREDGDRSRGVVPYRGPLMQFRVSSEVSADNTAEPQDLDLPPLPSWTQTVSGSDPFDKVWTVGGGSFIDPVWKINGKTFDPSYVEATPKRGDVVVWRIVNATSTAHLMHPHHTDWYLLGRNDSPPPAHEDCLKETFFMHPDERITIAGKMSDYLGKYVMHCHMLDHEDHGLMSQFEVVR